MVTLKYSGGFWFFLRDGAEVGHTGDTIVRDAERTTGLRVNHRCITVLDVVAAYLGADAVAAVVAYRESLPRPTPLSPAQQRARYRAELKGRR